MLKFAVVTKDTENWSRQRFKFSALDISLLIANVEEYQHEDGEEVNVKKLLEDLQKSGFDFVLCDLPTIYPHLPPHHTVLVGGRLPWVLANCIAAMRNSSFGSVIFYLWVKSPTPISSIVTNFLDEWGYPYTLPLIEGKKEENGEQISPHKFIFNIICSREGFMAAKNPIFYVLLPTEDAAHAFCNFLQRVLYDYTPPECLLKDALKSNEEMSE